MSPDVDTAPLPLSALDFHVLLVLADRDLYGYAIMKAVEEQSSGRVRTEVGSLYRVLARLSAEGLLEEADPPDDPEDHPGRRRRYYRLTPSGADAARAEAARLAEVLEVARQADLLPRGVR